MKLLRLTRRIQFSAGHRFWLGELSPEENRRIFGPWASPFNHGHNYTLDVETEGFVNPEHGMVVNIKRIDDILKERIQSVYDFRSINDEVPGFETQTPTLENLLIDIQNRLLGTLPEEVSLSRLRLEELPTLWAMLDLKKNIMTITRTYEFAASHRLHVSALSPAQNLELFGKCNNPMGHGHNYILEVTVRGEPDPVTGMMIDIGDLDATVHERIVDRYDHKNLNADLPEFEGKNTTSEVVALQIFEDLQGVLGDKLHQVRLHETARNIFEVSAG